MSAALHLTLEQKRHYEHRDRSVSWMLVFSVPTGVDHVVVKVDEDTWRAYETGADKFAPIMPRTVREPAHAH
jgi:hypothetical protein